MRWVFHVRPHTVEFLCEHGVGHPPCWVSDRSHGCESCCMRRDFPGRRPQLGDIALCGRGMPGIIASGKEREITYPDGEVGIAWIGLHLMEQRTEDPRHGTMWSSRNPCLIGTIEEFLTEFNGSMSAFVKARVPEGWPTQGDEK